MKAGYIAVDWGTTNRRAYLIDADGAVLDTVRDDRGGVAMPSVDQFVDVAAEVCGQGNGARRVRRFHAGLVGLWGTRVNKYAWLAC